MNVHIPRVAIDLNGEEHHLTCNLNVIAAIQDRYDGNFAVVGRKIASARELIFLLALMINEDRHVQARASGQPIPADIEEEEIGSSIIGDFKQYGIAVMETITQAFPPSDGKNVHPTTGKA